MSLLGGRRIRADSRGGFQLRLPRSERQLLSQLSDQLDEALASIEGKDTSTAPPESLRRLFPRAHPRDDADEAGYAALARPELVRGHREALESLREGAGASRVSASQLESCLSGLNDLRLVLGTSLGVSEESGAPPEDDPAYPQWVCYGYLSFLVGEIVDALAGQLPATRPGVDDAVPEDPWGDPPGGLRWDGTPLPEGG